MKYLGVIIDSKIHFDGEVKKILQRMDCGIKILKTLSEILPEKTKIFLLNAIVIILSTLIRFNFDRVAKVITHNFRKTFELGNKNHY